MGGKLKDGFCLVGGVVPIEIRNLLDEMKSNGEFESRSKAICYIISEFFKRRQETIDQEV